MDRLHAYVLSAVVLAAVASPPFRDPPEDSFPLSDYPMFSKARPAATIVLTNVVGLRRDGSQVVLSPQVSVGNDEVLQAMATIRNAVRAGRTRLAAFCEEAAERVADRQSLADVIEVRIATRRFDAIAYFRDGPEPERTVVHHRCEVRR